MYQGTTNLLPATGAEAMYSWLVRMVASGSAVQSWSDGTTYHAAPPGAGLTGFTSGAAGVDGLDNSKAWFVLALLDGRQFCVQRNAGSGASTSQNWRVMLSPANGFIGGTPGAQRVPTAADQRTLLGSGTDASPVFARLFAPDGTYTWSVFADNAAPYGWYAFAYTSNVETWASLQTVFAMEPLVPGTYPVEDIDPFLYWANGGALNLPFQGFENVDDSAGPWAYFKRSLAGEQFVRMTQQMLGGFSSVYYRTVPVDQGDGGHGLGKNPYTSKYEFLTALYGRRTTLLSAAGLKGQGSIFLYNASAQNPTGLAYDAVSTRDYIGLAGMVAPWDGSEPNP